MIRFRINNPELHISISIPGTLGSSPRLFKVKFLEVAEDGEVYGCLPSGRSVWTVTTLDWLLSREKEGLIIREDSDLTMDEGL